MRTTKEAEELADSLLEEIMKNHPELNFSTLLNPDFFGDEDGYGYRIEILNRESDWDTSGIISVIVEVGRKGDDDEPL